MTTTTMPPPAGPAADGPLTPTDHRSFAFLGQVNGHLRQYLCTLARHGVAVRRGEPERARALLDAVRPWPLYKGGQFLFDLMEWEDLMTDGAPPPLLPTERIVSASLLPVRWLADATAPAPGAAKLIPGQHTAAAFDLPLRLLAGTARAAFQGAAQDLTDLLGKPADHDGTDSTGDADDDAGYDATDHAGAGHDSTGYEGAAHAPDDAPAEPADTEPPPLEAGFYLYEDIALGALVVLGPLLADHAPPDPTPPA
ncbi:hypothetical protein ACFY8B_25785 [Streptomyces sp. NPDC012751]|uniref:hypothetical protein n=1 Tax=Streptomyces sp. NPDC012751 TaxID=3364846 RepID=UPI0036CE6240